MTYQATRRARAQLWGGHLDGLRANVEVGQFTGPPESVVVPVILGTVPLLLISGNEATEMYRDVETVLYQLDLDYAGDELLYRVERMAEA